MTAGSFTVQEADAPPGDFNLVQKQGVQPPDDQWAVAGDAYRTKSVLCLMHGKHSFDKDPLEFRAYLHRVRLAAESGCVIDPVNPARARSALASIRDDVVERKGRPAKYRYLTYLAFWGLGFLAIESAAPVAAQYALGWNVRGFAFGCAWMMCGAVIGAWFSLATTRREIAFEEMPQFLDFRYEPFIRLLFVSILAFVLALLIDVGAIKLEVAGIELAKFAETWTTAVLLGLICGIGEKAVTVRIVNRVQQMVSPASGGGTSAGGGGASGGGVGGAPPAVGGAAGGGAGSPPPRP